MSAPFHRRFVVGEAGWKIACRALVASALESPTVTTQIIHSCLDRIKYVLVWDMLGGYLISAYTLLAYRHLVSIIHSVSAYETKLFRQGRTFCCSTQTNLELHSSCPQHQHFFMLCSVFLFLAKRTESLVRSLTCTVFHHCFGGS